MYKLFDIISTSTTIKCPTATLRKGRTGTIVEILASGEELGYFVEFLGRDGQTVAMEILREDQIAGVSWSLPSTAPATISSRTRGAKTAGSAKKLEAPKVAAAKLKRTR